MFLIEQTDKEMLGSTAQIRYNVFFDQASRHLLRFSLEIDAEQVEPIELLFPSWMPGSYKIRDMMQHVTLLSIRDGNGHEVEWQWRAKGVVGFAPKVPGCVKVEYLYFANERGIRTSHVNRAHTYIVPVACMPMVVGRQETIHHVYLHTPAAWKDVTTSLSPVRPNRQPGEPHIVAAKSYDILADSPIEAGNHQKVSFEYAGAIHEVAIFGPEKRNIEWLRAEVEEIVRTQHRLWGDLPYDRYVFMLLVAEGQYGGLEHLRSNISACTPDCFTDPSKAQGLLTLLTHEYFHTWNIKRIRPRELGPFDYASENYTSMLWLAEGLTSYYDSLLAYRAGFYSQAEYLSIVAQQEFGKLDKVPGRFLTSLKDSSYLAWVKLYSMSPDLNNRCPSYYLKGGIFFLLMDLYIIAQSNGAKRLDDLVRAMWSKYKVRPELGLSEDEFFELAHQVLGFDIAPEFRPLLSQRTELDYNKYLSAFGLQFVIRQNESASSAMYGYDRTLPPGPTSVSTGVVLKEEGTRVIVREVEDGTPAAQAGIGIDDEIVAVNGRTIRTIQDYSDAMSRVGAGQTAKITISCDGILYEVEVAPAYAKIYAIEAVEQVTDAMQRLQDLWLARF